MAIGNRKARETGRPDPDEALTELGRALAGSMGAAGGGVHPLSEPVPAEVELSLAELISDANGEIVFFNDSGFRTLRLSTDAAVVADGEVGAHVAAGGADVTGCRFVRFDNGLTLYVGSDLDVVVRSEADRPAS